MDEVRRIVHPKLQKNPISHLDVSYVWRELCNRLTYNPSLDTHQNRHQQIDRPTLTLNDP